MRQVLFLILSWIVVLTACSSKGSLSEEERKTMETIRSKGGKMTVGYGTNGAISYSIDLSFAPIEDNDLSLFESGCSRVNSINLSNTNISGIGMPALASFVRVGQSIDFNLAGTNMAEDEILRIIEGQQLNSLSVAKTLVTDEFLTPLQEVLDLDLSKTKVTSKGVERLKGKEIRALKLRGLPLNDSDIPLLVDIGRNGCNHMDLTDTSITVKGYEKLEEGLVGYGVEVLGEKKQRE